MSDQRNQLGLANFMKKKKRFREIDLISLISYTCFHLASASALNSDPFNR